MNFLSEVKKNEKQMLEDMQKLLQIDSVLVENPASKEAPFGEGIKKSLDYMLELGKKFGFKTKNIQNVAGHIEFGEGKEIVGILCHVDVVPAQGKWKYPPFSATIDNDRIYARGAVDDKGPAICSLYAMKILKDLNVKMNKRIRLILGTDEETAWRCMKTYFENEEMPTVGFSPDANFPLIYGEKGLLSMDVESNENSDITFDSGIRYNVVPDEAKATINKNLQDKFEEFLKKYNLEGEYKDKIVVYGKSAHAMEPKLGINAAIKLCQFLSNHTDNKLVKFVSDKLVDSRFKDMGLNYTDIEMKDLTVNVAIVKIDEKHGKVGLNLRYPINWDKDEFLRDFKIQAEEYGLLVKVVSDKVPHYVDKNDDLVKTLHNAYIEYTNDTSSPLMTIGGGTYARALKKGVAFGITFPNREDVVHQIDEYLLIDDAILATAIITKAINDLGQ